MKEDYKFTVLINKIESELTKLEEINKNLAQIDNYVEEVSSIKNNLIKVLNDLLSNNQKFYKNTNDIFLKLPHYFSEIKDYIENELNALKNLNSENFVKYTALSQKFNDNLIKRLSEIENNLSTKIENTKVDIIKKNFDKLKELYVSIINSNKQEFHKINKKQKVLFIFIIINIVLLIANLIFTLIKS